MLEQDSNPSLNLLVALNHDLVSSPTECMSSIFVILKFKRAHLKFMVWRKQAFKKNIHTHVHNAVTLVWGSLRLTPISVH